MPQKTIPPLHLDLQRLPRMQALYSGTHCRPLDASILLLQHSCTAASRDELGIPSSEARQPPWPNGQGVGLLIRRLRVRVPQGVLCCAQHPMVLDGQSGHQPPAERPYPPTSEMLLTPIVACPLRGHH